jgi:hypothetical protein
MTGPLGGVCGRIGLGVLTVVVTPELVDEVVAGCGVVQQRVRALPARVVMYFVLAMCLFSGEGYPAVIRQLLSGLEVWRLAPGYRVPTSSALAKARRRLGTGPVRELFHRLAGPLATAATPGAGAFGLLLVTWDGSFLEVPDTPANGRVFGYPGRGLARGGYPQVRLMTLAGCGSRGLIDAVFGPRDVSEQKMAARLTRALRPGMLLLADRNFPGHDLWAKAAGTGADLLWRVPGSRLLPAGQVLSDGSWLSVLATPAAARRRARARYAGRPLPAMAGITVRVIEFIITTTGPGGQPRSERYRLATTLLDCQHAPAGQLAAVYARRWDAETGYGDLKTRLRGTRTVLRSKDPAAISQEIYALLATCQAVHIIAARAAHTAGIDPRRISFTATIRVLRRQVTHQAALSTRRLHHALAATTTEILSQQHPPRRTRTSPRTSKRPHSRYPAWQPTQPPSQPATHTITLIHPPAHQNSQGP